MPPRLLQPVLRSLEQEEREIREQLGPGASASLRALHALPTSGTSRFRPSLSAAPLVSHTEWDPVRREHVTYRRPAPRFGSAAPSSFLPQKRKLVCVLLFSVPLCRFNFVSTDTILIFSLYFRFPPLPPGPPSRINSAPPPDHLPNREKLRRFVGVPRVRIRGVCLPCSSSETPGSTVSSSSTIHGARLLFIHRFCSSSVPCT